jgi:hypothetical protein
MCLLTGGMLALSLEHFDIRYQDRAGAEVVSVVSLADTWRLLTITPFLHAMVLPDTRHRELQDLLVITRLRFGVAETQRGRGRRGSQS